MLFQPFAVVPKTDCPHVADRMYTLPQSAHRVSGRQPPCTDCGQKRENWACLEENCEYVSADEKPNEIMSVFSQIGCSRYQQKHMVAHYENVSHKIALSLSDHSFYCYACDSYIDSPKFVQLNEEFIAASQ